MRFCIVGYGSIGRRHHSVLSSIFSNSSFDIVDLNTELKIEDCIHSEYDVLIITTPTSSHLDVLSRFSKSNRLIRIIYKFIEPHCFVMVSKNQCYNS